MGENTFNSYYSSFDDSDEESSIDYTYKSNIIDTPKPKEIDQIDQLLQLYLPYEEVNNNVPSIKTKKSIWKKIIFLFSKNKE
jgi:hypothetical protein